MVTGAASGIGAATAIAFAQAGADVALGWLPGDPHDVGPVRAAVQAAGRRAVVNELDVTSTESVTSFVAAAFEAFGRIDVCVANAGIARTVPALYQAIRSFVPRLSARECANYFRHAGYVSI